MSYKAESLHPYIMNNRISVLSSQNETQTQDIIDIKDSLNSINDNLSNKVNKLEGVTGYQTVDFIGYDATNKKLGLKVGGADTVIPFSEEIDLSDYYDTSWITTTSDAWVTRTTHDTSKKLIGLMLNLNDKFGCCICFGEQYSSMSFGEAEIIDDTHYRFRNASYNSKVKVREFYQ